MKRALLIASLVAAACAGALSTTPVDAKTGIVTTKHNLSVSGPGELRALTETRICVFCHTPHNAAPATPLWNKKLEPVNYVLYTSGTMSAKPSQPTGPSRLCLSCHDGTVALGAVLNPAGGIDMTVAGGIPPARRSYLGTVLSDDHPISFSYYDSLAKAELAPSPPHELVLYGGGTIQCSTCHDAHDNTYKKFLAVDSRYSRLCTLCHVPGGWSGAVMGTAQNTWNGGLPNPWPRTGAGTDFGWTTAAENGCGNCHRPHSAGGQQWLLNYAAEEENCYPCHNGNVAARNVQRQFQKISRHPVDLTGVGATANYHRPDESPLAVTGHVECDDCHNPHAARATTASPPAAPGSLDRVSGVTINGAGILPPSYAQYEYEVCFKCHADSTARFPFVPRVVNLVNTRVEFNLGNPSYHPVAGTGKNPEVPSISSSPQPGLTAASILYCTDCHDSDESVSIGGAGPRGPHGSVYQPLIRERYETVDNTPESPAVYALCYRCHNRNSVLANESFGRNSAGKGGHSGHVGAPVNAPCSLCHDPHGVQDNGVSGDHTHLINFDTRSVSPASGELYPKFQDLGSRSGSCTLVCHGVAHDGHNATSAYRY